MRKNPLFDILFGNSFDSIRWSPSLKEFDRVLTRREMEDLIASQIKEFESNPQNIYFSQRTDSSLEVLVKVLSCFSLEKTLFVLPELSSENEIEKIQNFISKSFDFSQVPYERRVLMLLTSGTSGLPKAVLVTQAQVLRQIAAVQSRLGLEENHRVLVHLSLAHSGGLLMLLLPALAAQSEVHLIPPREPFLLQQALVSKEPSHFILRPFEYKRISQLTSSKDYLSRSSGVITGSYAIPQWFVSELVSGGVPLWNVFGSTEFGPFAFSQKFSDPREPVRLGEPSSGFQFQFSKDSELLVRGDLVSAGHLEKPLQKGEWFKTGDLVSGRPPMATFMGKRDRVISRDGTFVSPMAVEEWIHQKLSDLGYLGDALFALDEEGRAVLYIETPVELESAEKNAIKKDFFSHFSKPFWPSRWNWSDRIPRNEFGKPSLKSSSSY